MSYNVSIDWKFAAALGVSAVGIIFAVKLDALAVERVTTVAVDACKEYAIAYNSNR